MNLDLEIHSAIMVRLLDAPAPVAQKLRDQLGPVLTEDGLEQPDIVVEFPHELGIEHTRHIGDNFASFSGESFYVLDRATGATVAEIPFGSFDTGINLRCSRDSRWVHLLFDLLNFVMLDKGWYPLHASGVVMQGTGIVLTGWPKGGKTGALLALMDRGGSFVGDEWLFVSADGRRMLGLPTSVGVSEWQLQSLPHLLPSPGFQRRLLFWLIHRLESTHRLLAGRNLESTFIAKSLRKGLPYLRAQLKISRSPQSLFSPERCVFQGEPDKIFLLIGHDQPDVVIDSCASDLVARRMAIANRYEQRGLIDYYQAFRFAFPDSRSDLLEVSVEHEAELLASVLAGKETFLVSHPYGASLDRLGRQIMEYL